MLVILNHNINKYSVIARSCFKHSASNLFSLKQNFVSHCDMSLKNDLSAVYAHLPYVHT